MNRIKKGILGSICTLILLLLIVTSVMARETFIVGYDLQGTFTTVPGSPAETNPGFFSITGERLFEPNSFFQAGYGLAIEGPRSLKNQVGNFGFVPLYGVVNCYPLRRSFPVFITARTGYDFWYGDNDFKADRKLIGGLYYGAGLGFGISAQPNSPKFLLLYSVDNGTFQNGSTSEVKYDKISLNLVISYDDFL